MGRYIDRVGEKRPLTIYAGGIILIFIGYASFQNPAWLCALYLVDNVLFTFSISLNTYLHRIVRPGELTPCLAMGTTMNHVAAVALPVIGAAVDGWARPERPGPAPVARGDALRHAPGNGVRELHQSRHFWGDDRGARR